MKTMDPLWYGSYTHAQKTIRQNKTILIFVCIIIFYVHHLLHKSIHSKLLKLNCFSFLNMYVYTVYKKISVVSGVCIIFIVNLSALV